MNRHRAKIRSTFFIVACSAVLATGIFVVLRSLNTPVLENGPSANSKVALRSTIREAPALNWKLSTVNLPPGTSIEQIQMLNAKDGWLAAYPNELYKTSDGGELWTRVQLKLPARSYLTDVQFVTQEKGWIAVSRTELDFDEASGTGTYDNATWIFETNDGGKTLSERVTIKDAQILQLHFAENEGWATGRRLAKAAPERDSNFVLHTSNGGKEWEDLSTKLPPDTGVERLRVIGPGTALAMTHDGSIHKTADGGANWKRIDKLNYENEQAAIWRLNLASNERLWVLGGASAIEGTHSVFAIKDEGQDWVIQEINNVHLTDALFLSDSEVLACGSLIVETN